MPQVTQPQRYMSRRFGRHGVGRGTYDWLVPDCSSCHASLSDIAKFCDQCGTRVEQAAPAPAASLDLRIDGERRQVTVFFCDLVGSTELAAKLDPEAYNVILNQYYDDVTSAVRANGGFVYQLLGDGVLALFGYPDVHEDSAQRAVAAALQAQENVDQGTARIGIHTGWVILSEVENAGTHAVGSATNVAARVQTAAEPDDVLLSDVTHQLVHRHFEIEDAGMHNLKGLPAPVGLYRAVAARSAPEPAASASTVGRTAEIDRILHRWAAVLEGETATVVLRGEPGIGKSQVLRAVGSRLDATGATRLHLEATERTQHTPFAPIIELLNGLVAGSTGDDRSARLRSLLDASGREDATDRGAIARLLGVDLGEHDPTVLLPSEARRTAIIDAAVGWILSLADRRPVVLTVEDLHWIDASSMELLHTLVERAPGSALMMFATARPEFDAEVQVPTAEVVDLGGLDRTGVASIVHDMIGSEASPALIEEILERSEGVPLFVEELARAHQRVELSQDAVVPATLHDLLASRFGQLGPGREVAQVASVLGRDADIAVLESVIGAEPGGLDTQLDELVAAGLVQRTTIEGEPSLRFHHALLRDSAYETLLHKQRRDLHERTARSLREVRRDVTSRRPELLAYHWSEAGDALRSIRYWSRAGELASGRSAYVEALAHYDHALEQLAHLDDDVDVTELNIQNARKQLIVFLSGYASDDYVKVVERVRELGANLGQDAANFSALSDAWGVALSRGDIAASHDIAQQLLDLSAGSDKIAKSLWAEQTLVASLTNMGRFEEAMDRALGVVAIGYERPELYADAMARQALLQVRIYLGLSAVQLDRFDEASRVAEESLEIANDDHGNAIDRAVALTIAIVVYSWMQAFDKQGEIVEALRRSSEETGFPLHAGWADIYGGWAAAKQGDAVAGLDTLLRGIECHVRLDQRLGLGQYLGLVAEAQLLNDDPDAALITITNAIELAEEQTWHRPELYRIRALVLDHLRPAEADAAFELARAEATERGSLLVLRRLEEDLKQRGVPT